MGKKSKKGAKGRLDKYLLKFYHLAKEQGFRSRAAFKLIQLNKKFDFLSSARAVLDLCAAPGGWYEFTRYNNTRLQVAAKYTPVSSLIIGVDLDPIKPIKNVTTFQGDITTAKCRSEIKRILQTTEKVDVVLHDGAPNVGKAWAQDAFTQSELVLASLKLTTEFLRKGGCFITKVFRSADYNSLLWVFNQLFKKVQATKPVASRNTSAEIFVVCQGYFQPDTIDPRLLDSKFVFKEVDPSIPVRSIFAKHKKPPRLGYEEGNLILFKKVSVAKFIEAEEPIKFLALYNQLEFDEEAQVFKKQKETTTEIVALCNDLKVLGKSDFKLLLKWRTHMQKYRTDDQANDEEEEEEEQKKPLTAEEQEAKEMEQLENDITSMKEKERRKLKKKVQQKRRLRQKLQLLQLAAPDAQEDLDLFALDHIKDDRELSSVSAADPEELAMDSDDDDELNGTAQTEGEDNEDEDHESAYLNYIEDTIDSMYAEYLGAKKKKQKDMELHDTLNIQEADPTESQPSVNSLVVRSNAEEGTTQKTRRWFSQDLFTGIEAEGEDELAIQSMKQQFLKKKQEEDTKRKVQEIDVSEDDSDSENVSKRQKVQQDFEEVALQKYDSDDEDDEDMDEKVKGLALASVIVNNKNAKQALLDNAFNRYTFAGDEDLPTWFKEEEHEHTEIQLPVTKEEVQSIKNELAELNARPMKKVAEAKARKKMRLTKRLEKAQNQAESISQASDLAPADKMRAIEKLYKKAKKGLEKKTVLIVNRKSGGRVATGQKKTKGSRIKLVDSRMKKDLRSKKRKR